MQRGLSATYPAPISTIFNTKDVCPHAYTDEKFPNFCGGFPGPKTAKMGNFDGVLVRGVQLKRHNFGFRAMGIISGAIVNILRMCLLYLSFGGGRTVWAL